MNVRFCWRYEGFSPPLKDSRAPPPVSLSKGLCPMLPRPQGIWGVCAVASQVPGLKITEHVINHLGPAWAWLQGDLRIAASALELLGRLPPGDRRRPVDVYHTNRTLVHSLNASEATHRPDPFLLDSALAADYRALFALLERRWGAPAAGLRWVHFRSLGRDFIDDNEAQGADRGLAEGGGLAQLLFFSVQTLQRGPEGDGDREEWVARCEGSLVSLTLAPEFRGRPVCLNAGAGEPEAILDRHKVRYTQELDGEMVCFFEYFKDLSPEEVCLLLRWNAASGPPDANAPAGLAKADVYLFWSCLRHFGSVDAALRYAALAAAEVALPPAAAAAKAEGNAHFRAKEYKRAVAAYSAALRDTPAGTLHAATLLTNRAAAYLQLRKEEKAADDCTQALAVHPRHPKALYRRACAYRAMRRWDECVADAVCLDVSTAEVLQLLLELDPGSPVRGHYKWLGAGGAGVNMAVVGQLRACSLCGAQEPFPHKFRRCGRCKSVRYCGEACQRRAWKEHKLVCGKVPEDMASVVVLPHQEGQKYYGHHVPKGLEAARAAIAGLMQAAAEDVEAFQPVRGEAELIRDVVLFQARRTALARGLGQNVRGSIILTPLSAGGLFTKSDADGAALGPVVVARLAPSGAELVDLPVKEFQGLWGMMTLIPLGDGQCAGIVLPKTKAAEQDLAAVLQAGLAGLERRAEAHTP